MKNSVVTIICAAFIGAMAVSSPAIAQQKTVKACEDEWKANKDANQAKKITEKAYVEKCRADSAGAKPAAATTAAPAKTTAAPEKKAATPAAAEKKSAASGKPEKTVKACEDEWKANKEANQAKKITEKTYVEKCRAEGAAATTTTPAAPTQAKPSTTTAAPTTTTAPTTTSKPIATTAPAPTASVTPTGANQYAAEAQAKARCPSATVVWANLDSKIYHFAGHNDYGHTKSGAYMCETDATAQGMRAAKNEKHP